MTASSCSFELHRAGSGEPLVLIHGFTSSWRNWLPVLPALEQHHDVLAVRLAGHYEAPTFPEEAAYRIRALAGCSAFQALLATIGRDAPPRGLDGVDCPVLLIWPTHDRVLPKAGYARYFLDALPDAELQEPHGLGHVPTFDDPDGIAHSILTFTGPDPIDRTRNKVAKGSSASSSASSLASLGHLLNLPQAEEHRRVSRGPPLN